MQSLQTPVKEPGFMMLKKTRSQEENDKKQKILFDLVCLKLMLP